MIRLLKKSLLVSAASLSLSCIASCQEFSFEGVELKTKLTVGYAVKPVDVNHDGKLDIAIVDSKRILWLENPTWEEHVIDEDSSKTDNVCFAAHDIDGDGKVDFAVGADWTLNTNDGGTIGWLKQTEQPKWNLRPLTTEPTVHRIQFIDLDGSGKPKLVVAPLMGRGSTRPNFAESPVRLLALTIPADPVNDPWPSEVINEELHVTHNFIPTHLNDDKIPELLVVSFEGVHLLERDASGKYSRTRIGSGNQETSPNRGASEIKRGVVDSKHDYIATIEPWHGHQVVVYTRPDGPRPQSGDWLWNRHVIDEELKWGHAVWCANVDGDEAEELIIGVRDTLSADHPCGVRIYDPDPNTPPSQWKRMRIDAGGVAVEDLATADFDGDGDQDIVAVGRATHNVKIYWNKQ